MSDFEYQDDDDFQEEITSTPPQRNERGKPQNSEKDFKEFSAGSDASLNELFNNLFNQQKSNNSSNSNNEKESNYNIFEQGDKTGQFAQFSSGVTSAFNYSKKYVVGQDAVLKDLVTLLAQYRINPRMKFSPIFTSGPSGSGKTYSIRTVCKALDIPFYEVDSTSVTPEGYKGTSLSEVLTKMATSLLEQNQNAIRPANSNDNTIYGVVFFDEFMKKLIIKNEGNESLSHMVRNEFLKILEPNYEINGYKLQLQFILADAMSFAKNKKISKDLLVELGMSEELVGRIRIISPFVKLTEENCEQILRLKTGRLYERSREAEKIGLHFIVKCDAFKALSKQAANSPFGARLLRDHVDTLFDKLIQEAVFSNYNVSNITIDERVVHAIIGKNNNLISSSSKNDPTRIGYVLDKSKRLILSEGSDSDEQGNVDGIDILNSMDGSAPVKYDSKEVDLINRKVRNYEILLKCNDPVFFNQMLESIDGEINGAERKLIESYRENGGKDANLQKYSELSKEDEKKQYLSTLSLIHKVREDLISKDNCVLEKVKFHNEFNSKLLDIYLTWIIEKCPFISICNSFNTPEIVKYDKEWEYNIEHNLLKLIYNVEQNLERCYNPLIEFLVRNDAYSTIQAIFTDNKIPDEARERANELSSHLKKASNVLFYEKQVKSDLKKRIQIN